MRQSNLVEQIKDAVRRGRAQEPFKSLDFSFLINNPSFISKHAVGNGK